MKSLVNAIAILLCMWVVSPAGELTPPSPSRVPGLVIDHLPASSGTYVGSPSIAVLPGGDYVASHDLFGPSIVTSYTSWARWLITATW
jgi:hypothetical protein